MKRIGNFLFVEQWFQDAVPCQAVIAINAITCIFPQNFRNTGGRTVIELSTDSKFILTGKHEDNIITLAKLLEKPTSVAQVFETWDNFDLTLNDKEDDL